MYDFVESYDTTTGEIIYKKPNIGIICMHVLPLHTCTLFLFLMKGSSPSLWSNGIAVQGVAMLMCVVLNNFHSMATYKWNCIDVMLGEDELYPVIYVTSSGKYECVVSIPLIKKQYTRSFTVEGDYSKSIKVILYITITSYYNPRIQWPTLCYYECLYSTI